MELPDYAVIHAHCNIKHDEAECGQQMAGGVPMQQLCKFKCTACCSAAVWVSVCLHNVPREMKGREIRVAVAGLLA
jgi:hypothetical protein